jgi:D-threo-aldose 1-dehydrogenase
MYGLGATEREVGRFLKTRRDQVTVATKFGIDAPSFGPLSRLQGPARALLRRYPQIRSLVKRRADEIYAARDYTPGIAKQSLHTSLHELGVDYVDMFLLHEPSPRDNVDVDGLGQFLEEQVAAGTIRSWGVSGEPEDALPVAAQLGDVTLQLSDSALASPRTPARAPRPPVTFRVLTDTLPSVLGALRQPALRGRWSETLGVDLTSDTVARLLLQEALDANPEGAVLFASTKQHRVAAACAAAVEGSDAPLLATFRDLLDGLREADDQRAAEAGGAA